MRSTRISSTAEPNSGSSTQLNPVSDDFVFLIVFNFDLFISASSVFATATWGDTRRSMRPIAITRAVEIHRRLAEEFGVYLSTKEFQVIFHVYLFQAKKLDQLIFYS